MKLLEAETYLISEIKKLNLGWCTIQMSQSICDSILIRWSVEPRAEWLNGILQNAWGGNIHIFSATQREEAMKAHHKYEYSYTNWRCGYNMRKASNHDLKKLCDTIVKQLAKSADAIRELRAVA